MNIIWNRHEKYIQISTNMLGIGLEFCEISRILRSKTMLLWVVKPVIPMAVCKVLKIPRGKGMEEVLFIDFAWMTVMFYIRDHYF